MQGAHVPAGCPDGGARNTARHASAQCIRALNIRTYEMSTRMLATQVAHYWFPPKSIICGCQPHCMIAGAIHGHSPPYFCPGGAGLGAWMAPLCLLCAYISWADPSSADAALAGCCDSADIFWLLLNLWLG